MEDRWTDKQRQAFSDRGKNILVAAAAGSGKTAVLVQRIIKQVLDGDTDIDRLLVVTFTNAAAEEMRLRIAEALSAAAKENPLNERIAQQQILLSNASISTIHSFCQTTIRRNFTAIDLDPKFRLAGEQELFLLKQDVLEELFEEKYSQKDEVFLRFVDEYGDEHGDGKLHDIINRLYNYSQSQPFPEKWLDKLSADFKVNNLEELENIGWLQEVRAEVQIKLQEAIDITEYLIEKAADIGLEGYVPTYENDRALLGGLLDIVEKSPWDKVQESFMTAKFVRLSGGNKDDDAEAKEYLKAVRQEAKDIFTDLQKKYFGQNAEEMVADIISSAPVMEKICQLTKEFTEKYREVKLEKTILDFNDLEHYAFAVLRAADSDTVPYEPSPAALALQAKYTEVMVDEYQDINALQDAILSLVMRKDKPSSFVVGDVKQSIYGFRMADSEIFQQKYKEYNNRGEQYERIGLSQNFRSRESVLEGINYIFRQIMQEKSMELAYDDAAALYPGAKFAETDKPYLGKEIELDIIDMDDKPEEEKAAGHTDEELKGFKAEAVHIANRIKALVKSGVNVYDEKVSGNYRPVRWRDIVILMRSVKGKINTLTDVLRENGIPAYATDDAGFFEETEIKVIVSLLSIIDNARQDIPLAAVLYSPIGGFSAGELAEIRLNAPQDDLYSALLKVNEPDVKAGRGLKKKTAIFLQKFSAWRDLARQVSVPELIWQLYRDTGYYEYVGSMPGGLQRQANLRMLIDRAEAYEKTDFRGLFRFLRFIERMNESDSDLAIAATLGESENVVRIMSIHKSKGLEFPIVILGDIDKGFNQRDARDTLLIDKQLGLGPYCSPAPDFHYPTVARQAVAARKVRAEKAEEMRIMYVALTRAKEKLILTGKGKKLGKKLDHWCRYAGYRNTVLPAQAVSGGNSYLDWLIMALIRHPDGEILRNLASFQDKYLPLELNSDTQWKIDIVPLKNIVSGQMQPVEEERVMSSIRARQPLPETDEKDIVTEILDWNYDYKGLRDVPAKLSVTELKRRFGKMEEDFGQSPSSQRVFRRPEFVRQGGGITAGEYGTIMHTVLQHIDFSKKLDRDEICRQLELMTKKEILSDEEQKNVRVDSIERFFASEIGQRLKTAKNVYRELPFSRMLKAKRFYSDIADEDAEIFSQGIIDLLIEEEDGFVLVDYKTDKDTDVTRAKNKYALQLLLYAEAVETLLGKQVKEEYIFLLDNASFVKLK